MNTLPSVFKTATFKKGGVNADIGAGKYDKASKYLAKKGVKNAASDPHNRTPEQNAKAKKLTSGGKASTATVANVLNVIQSAAERQGVIRKAHRSIAPDGVAYFSVYTGDGSGVGKKTTKGWQENRPLSSYESEIKKVFPHVKITNGHIEARKKAPEGEKSKKEDLDEARKVSLKPGLYDFSGGSIKVQVKRSKALGTRFYGTLWADDLAEDKEPSDREAETLLKRAQDKIGIPLKWNGEWRRYTARMYARSVTTDVEFMVARDTELAKWVESEVMKEIVDAYKRWKGSGGREPSLTVTHLAQMLQGNEKYKMASRSQREGLVRSALNRLKKKGKVESSIGRGMGGRGARMYNPAGFQESLDEGFIKQHGDQWCVHNEPTGLVVKAGGKRRCYPSKTEAEQVWYRLDCKYTGRHCGKIKKGSIAEQLAAALD